MSMDPAQNHLPGSQPGNQNRSLIITAWVLMGIVCLVSVIPFLGFGSWLIAGPILFITLVMGIIVLSRGETMPGLFILLASLIAAPIFILVAPFVSSLLGFGGAVAAVGTTAEATSRSNPPSQFAENSTKTVPMPAAPSESRERTANTKPFADNLKDASYVELKASVQRQDEQIATLKSLQLATEGVQGYLASSDVLNLEQRHLVQQENVLRERIFELIAKRTGRTQEEVAAVFTEMARRSNANDKAGTQK